MYYHIKDRKWFDNRKQAKEHYGIACFRKLLHLKEINRELSDGQQ